MIISFNITSHNKILKIYKIQMLILYKIIIRKIQIKCGHFIHQLIIKYKGIIEKIPKISKNNMEKNIPKNDALPKNTMMPNDANNNLTKIVSYNANIINIPISFNNPIISNIPFKIIIHKIPQRISILLAHLSIHKS